MAEEKNDITEITETLLAEAREVFRMDYKEIEQKTKYHIKQVKELACHLYAMMRTIPDGRERSLAITKLEESIMWATKALTK